MISAKKLIKLAKKWQKMAAIRRKRITLPPHVSDSDMNGCSTSSRAEKGHFVVYSIDQRRFALPLEYLNREIVRELFNLAEAEFGAPSSDQITLPCDGAFMEYVIKLVTQNVCDEIEHTLLISIASNRCSPSFYVHQNQQLPICSF